MNGQLLSYLIPYFVSVAISTGVGLYAWRRRAVSGATPFALMALAQASWTLGFVFELTSPGLEAKIFWDDTQWVGALVAPLALLAFALQYAGRKLSRPKRTWGLLASVPAVFMLLVLTNDLHGWIRPTAWLVPGEPFDALEYDFTVPVWAVALYAYGLALAVVFILVAHFRHSQPLYRRQVGMIIIGVLIPLLGAILTLVGLTPTFHRDMSPFTFAVGNLVIAWGLFRYRMFDVVPVARDALVESMSDAVIVLDVQNRLVDFNPAAQKLTGLAASEVIGKPATQVFSQWPDTSATLSTSLVEPYQGVAEAHTEIAVGAGAGQRHFDLNFSPLRDRRGRLTGRLVVLHDVSERKQAEQEIRQRAAHIEALNTALEYTANGIVITDRAGTIMWVNPAFSHLTGYAAEEAIGRNPRDLVKSGKHDRSFYKNLWDTILAGKVWRGEIINHRKDGSLYTEEMAIAPVRDERGEIIRFIAIKQDITERKRAEEEERRRQEQMQRQEERHRLARELHDSVTQALYSATLYADATGMALSAGRTEVARENLEELRSMVREAMRDMRALIFELHPPVLEKEGLVGALRARLGAVEARSGIAVQFQVEGERRLPLATEAELYRIAQEVLTNIARHARARQVTVHLRFEACPEQSEGTGRFCMQLQDDGVGFDVATARQSGGLGLRSIEERVRQMGGRLAIDSAPGEGTTLRVEVGDER